MTGERARPRVRPAVAAVHPYVPGRSFESVRAELGLDTLVKLNQNENPLGPSPRALAAAASALHGAALYPEGTVPTLRHALAAAWELPEGWIVAGNGSDEVFRLLAETYVEPGDAVVVPAPSFAGYPLVAEIMGARVITVPLHDDALDLSAMARAALRERASLLFLCRPNNPTGTVFSEAALRQALDAIPPDTIVVLDEAYREFDDTPFDSRAVLLDHPNLVVTRTFSKLYGMAGLRLGYGVMHPELLAPLLAVRDPFSVNSVAAAAGIAALGDREHVARTLTLVREGRALLVDRLAALGLVSVPSHANFILFHTDRPAAEIADALLRHGVLVRPCASFGLPHAIRVTIGTREGNETFVAALEHVLAGR